jgi:hypothetical protein
MSSTEKLMWLKWLGGAVGGWLKSSMCWRSLILMKAMIASGELAGDLPALLMS